MDELELAWRAAGSRLSSENERPRQHPCLSPDVHSAPALDVLASGGLHHELHGRSLGFVHARPSARGRDRGGSAVARSCTGSRGSAGTTSSSSSAQSSRAARRSTRRGSSVSSEHAVADEDDDGERRPLSLARGRGGSGDRLARGRVAALASSEERMEEISRQAGWAKTFGLPLELISPTRRSPCSRR